jgi:hypothetical protein
MFSVHKNPSENLTIFVLASFAFASILGIGMSMEMKDDQMSSCPFMISQATLCQMSVTEHIAKWQQSLLGIPTKTNFLVLVVVLLAVVIISFIKLSQLKALKERAARLFAYQKTYFLEIFDPLLLAFSNGIINPKIYEPARI